MEYVGLLVANAFMLWALLYVGLFTHEMGHALMQSQYSHVVTVDVIVGRKGTAKRFFRLWKWRFFFGHGFEGVAIRYSDRSKRFQLPLNVRVWQKMLSAFAGPVMSLITAVVYIWLASTVSIFFMLPFLIAGGVIFHGGVYASLLSGVPGTDGHTIIRCVNVLRNINI